MDQGRTPETNRFIFSDAFYDQLGSEPEEKKVSFDAPVIPPVIETKKEEVIKEEVNSNFFNPNSSTDSTFPSPLIKFVNLVSKFFKPCSSTLGLIMITLSYLFIILHLLMDI